MELWIRSQNKKRLIKISELMVRDDYISEQNLYSIATFSNDKTMGYTLKSLGTYSTEERALEVLDEIQKYLRYSRNAEINNNNFLKYLNEVCDQEKCNKILDNISVYEMPEK